MSDLGESNLSWEGETHQGVTWNKATCEKSDPRGTNISCAGVTQEEVCLEGVSQEGVTWEGLPWKEVAKD